MEAASDKPRFWTACRPVLGFGACLFVIGVGLSLLALLLRDIRLLPWLDGLSWWRIFRRCVSLAAALTLWFVVCKSTSRTLRSYGFSAPKAGKRQFQFGVLLGLGVVALLLGTLVLTGACRWEVIPDRIKLWRVVLTFIPAAVLVGVLEELTFRGVILQHLLRYSTSLAVLASSTLYALVHMKTIAFTRSSGMELVGLFLLGGVLAISFLQTQQLYFAVGLHAALAYGARVNKLFVDFSNDSMAWLVGTSRLTNGLINWVMLVILGGVIVWWGRSLRSKEVRNGTR